MRLLVIDDAPWNLGHYALRGLAGHDVVTAAGLAAACEILKEGCDTSPEEFDAILTDLWMPYEPNCLHAYNASRAEDSHIGKLIPAGAIFALVAASRGVKAAICTDSNHHTDRLVEVMDLLAYERAPIVKVEARSVHARDKGQYVYHNEMSGRLVVRRSEGYFDLGTGEQVLVLVGKSQIVKDWGQVLELLLGTTPGIVD